MTLSASSVASSAGSFIDQARALAQQMHGQGRIAELEDFRKRLAKQGDANSLQAVRATFDLPTTPQTAAQSGSIRDASIGGLAGINQVVQGAQRSALPIQRGAIDNTLYKGQGVARILSDARDADVNRQTGATLKIQDNAFGRGLTLLDRTIAEGGRNRDFAANVIADAMGNERYGIDKFTQTAADLVKSADAASRPTGLDWAQTVLSAVPSLALMFNSFA